MHESPQAYVYGMRYVPADGISRLVDEVHIVGHGFGNDVGTAFFLPVKPGNMAPVVSWSDSKIVVAYTGTKNNPVPVFSTLRIVLANGAEALNSAHPLDIGVVNKDEAWTLTSSSQNASTGEITFVGDELHTVKDVFLIENGTDAEYLASIVDSGNSTLKVALPVQGSGPFDRVILAGEDMSGSKLATEFRWAHKIDDAAGDPGFVGWIRPNVVSSYVDGRGIHLLGMSSLGPIGQVRMYDTADNLLYRGVASSGPEIWDPSHNRSQFVQANYTDSTLDELVVRWPTTVLPATQPGTYTEPIVKMELISTENLLVKTVYPEGADWSLDPVISSVSFNGATRKIEVTGDHLLSAHAFIMRIQPSGGGQNSNVIFGNLSADPYTSIETLEDGVLVTLGVDGYVGDLWGFEGDFEIVEFSLYTIQNLSIPAATLDLSGAPVQLPNITKAPPALAMTAASAYGPHTIEIEGSLLNTLSIIGVYFTNGQGVAVANPAVHPNANTINNNNGNEIISWTSSSVIVKNALNPYGVVFGGKTCSRLEGYLYGSGTPDINFDCPDFPIPS